MTTNGRTGPVPRDAQGRWLPVTTTTTTSSEEADQVQQRWCAEELARIQATRERYRNGRSLGLALLLLLSLPALAAAQAHAIIHEQLNRFTRSPSVRALQSGPWSGAATWGGAVPADGATVEIPAGVTVTVDQVIPAAPRWVSVHGLLRFQPTAQTALTVGTLVIQHHGRLEIGTVKEPITGSVLLTLSSFGRDFDHAIDPFELTVGLVALGQVTMHGRAKTAFVPVSILPAQGSTRITLDQVPTGWQANDRLVLTGTTYDQHDELTLERVEAGEARVREPLKFARAFPAAGLSVHLANLSRNIVIRSDPAAAGNVRRQAHVMLMADPHAHDLRFVEFRDLGRTTISPVTDPRLLADGTRDPSLCPPYLPAENVRGRYALHVHHVGPFTAPVRHYVQGVSIHVKKHARLKFGFINHSSNVVVEDAVGYNVDGSTFMTEEGNEIGAIRRSLAMSSLGSNASNEDQPREIHLEKTCPAIQERRRLDMGHNGSGFWIHSAGVDTEGNVAYGHTNAGFDFWTQPLHKENSFPHLEFEVKHLRPGAKWTFADEETLPLNRVPGLFRHNVAYAAGFQRNGRKAGFALSHGLQAYKNPTLGKTLIDGFLAWNVVNGIDSEYTGSTIWRNIRVLAGNRAPGSVGIELRRQAEQSNNEVSDAQVVGFATCLRLGDQGISKNVACTDTPPPPPPPAPAPKAPLNLRLLKGQ